MSIKLIQFIFLISSVCFVLSLQGLSSHKTARNGNIIGIIGMLLALSAAFYYLGFNKLILAISAISIGAVIGSIIAKRIAMTELPQLIAGFHSLVGLAAVLIACSVLVSPETFNVGVGLQIKTSNLIEMSLGAIIGAITFTGSIIAFLKLQGSKVPIIKGQQYISIINALMIVGGTVYFVTFPCYITFTMLIILACLIGVLLISPVGGADMPVIVSMLNSYSGWATSGIGFTLNNQLLIITGALIGTSGAILSYIMCKSMNRSIFNVIFKAFGEQLKAKSKQEEDRAIHTSDPEDAAHILCDANSVIIVPGYGMAVAQAQHAIRELTDQLEHRGINVRFAIHPVAGRMPGHMNVLLSEANIDYTKVFELEEINNDFTITDVVLVVGANDITNPSAKNDPLSPIYGMPILEVEKAKRVYFIKRSMSQGYAGIDNELFYYPNTMMLFGDAKKVVESIVKNLEKI